MSIADFLISFAVALATFGICSGGTAFWHSEGFQIFPSAGYALFYSAILILLGLVSARFRIKEFKLSFLGFASAFLLLFFSDWISRRYAIFAGPSIRGELITTAILVYLFRRSIKPNQILLLTIASSVILLTAFMGRAHGRPIITDDHASFLYRIALLKDYFPRIPLYNPLWNAGLDARDFFATGSLNFFLINSPIFYIFDVTRVYTLTVGLMLFVYLPLSVYFASRFLKASNCSAALSALVAISSSLIWYRWALKYGTMGFVTSACLSPTVFALSVKLICGENLNRKQLVALAILTSLMLAWAGSGLILVPLAVIALFYSRTLFKNRQFWQVALAVVVLVGPQLAMLWKVSRVNTFLTVENSTTGTHEAFRYKKSILEIPDTFQEGVEAIKQLVKDSIKAFRETASSSNPLILLLTLPGILLLEKKYRMFFWLETIVLIIAGSALVTIKPQLELDRMLVLLTLLSCIPVGFALEKIVFMLGSTRGSIVAAATLSFVIVGPFCVSNVIFNRSLEAYSFASDLPDKVESIINKYRTAGRVVFSGFILHDLDGGHIAPLTTWTGTPLVASSPFHNRWKYTSVFPDSFLSRQDEGVTEYLDDMNAELVVAHEQGWRKYFTEHPAQYDLVDQAFPFQFFRRRGFKSQYFIEGQGEILRQEDNKVVLRVNSPSAVIKFNYYPFLVSNSCSLSPRKIAPEIDFIELKDCVPGTEITIKAGSPFHRLFSK